MRCTVVVIIAMLAGCGKSEGTGAVPAKEGKESKTPNADRTPVGTIDAGALWLNCGENQANFNSNCSFRDFLSLMRRG